jgi:hypothetical protein
MLKGKIHFEADVLQGSITFEEFAFPLPGPQTLEAAVVCRVFERVTGWIRVESVASDESGAALAEVCFESLLDRLAFFHGMAIEKARRSGAELEPMSPPIGERLITVSTDIHIRTNRPTVRRTLTSTDLTQVAKITPSRGEYFSLYRSALQSTSLVEEYMHLYVILLTVFNDSQRNVDEHVRKVEPRVGQSRSPKTGAMETDYTRLRNELAHRREGVDLKSTKAEILNNLAGLREVVRRALIEPT